LSLHQEILNLMTPYINALFKNITIKDYKTQWRITFRNYVT
jgi:hypothetical protein